MGRIIFIFIIDGSYYFTDYFTLFYEKVFDMNPIQSRHVCLLHYLPRMSGRGRKNYRSSIIGFNEILHGLFPLKYERHTEKSHPEKVKSHFKTDSR